MLFTVNSSTNYNILPKFKEYLGFILVFFRSKYK